VTYGLVEVEDFFGGGRLVGARLVLLVELVEVGARLVVVVAPVVVPVVRVPAPEPLDDLTGAPKAAIRHPFEVSTSTTGRSDAVWPLAPVSVMADALDPCTLIRPTANVGWWRPEKKIRRPRSQFSPVLAKRFTSEGAKTSVQSVFASWWAIATPNCCTFARTCWVGEEPHPAAKRQAAPTATPEAALDLIAGE
jgi:hypothetical protein